MNPEQEISDLKAQVDSYKKTTSDLVQRLETIEKTLREHKHEGENHDGSSRLQREIDLLPLQSIGAGGVGGITGYDDNVGNVTTFGMTSGRDQTLADGFQNTEMALQHYYATDTAGGQHQSFFYGFRGPVYYGTSAYVTSGGSTLTQNEYVWETDELVGAYVQLSTTASADTWDVMTITANTARSLTITGNGTGGTTWSFGGGGLYYFIFYPIYLGSANYPWRRIYTTDGQGGGIRFGEGNTSTGAASQNGRLFSQGGDIYWMKPGSGPTKLN